MSKAKIKDTQPKTRIVIQHGDNRSLCLHFGLDRYTIKKYIDGAALSQDAKARAKVVREYALNELNAFYAPK